MAANVDIADPVQEPPTEAEPPAGPALTSGEVFAERPTYQALAAAYAELNRLRAQLDGWDEAALAKAAEVTAVETEIARITVAAGDEHEADREALEARHTRLVAEARRAEAIVGEGREQCAQARKALAHAAAEELRLCLAEERAEIDAHNVRVGKLLDQLARLDGVTYTVPRGAVRPVIERSLETIAKMKGMLRLVEAALAQPERKMMVTFKGTGANRRPDWSTARHAARESGSVPASSWLEEVAEQLI
jgi:hypothetical protein